MKRPRLAPPAHSPVADCGCIRLIGGIVRHQYGCPVLEAAEPHAPCPSCGGRVPVRDGALAEHTQHLGMVVRCLGSGKEAS